MPNFFEMHVFGVQDLKHYDRSISYWSDVYGFKMPTLKNAVVRDAQVTIIKPESVVTNMIKFKEIDCSKCTSEEVAKFNVDFCLDVENDSTLTGIGCSFDCFFNENKLENKVNILN
jgi:protein arginine N-methyltransferase 3